MADLKNYCRPCDEHICTAELSNAPMSLCKHFMADPDRMQTNCFYADHIESPPLCECEAAAADAIYAKYFKAAEEIQRRKWASADAAKEHMVLVAIIKKHMEGVEK